jgi:hypothetical protein
MKSLSDRPTTTKNKIKMTAFLQQPSSTGARGQEALSETNQM